jgi:hypothetical protein
MQCRLRGIHRHWCIMVSIVTSHTRWTCSSHYHSSACNMWFRCITEIEEVNLPPATHRPAAAFSASPCFGKSVFGKPAFINAPGQSSGRVRFGPSPLKRNLDEHEGRDEDYTRFKRIRIVSKMRRVKCPKAFTAAPRTNAFGGSQVNVFANFTTAPTDNAGREPRFYGLEGKDTLKIARQEYFRCQDYRLRGLSKSASKIFTIIQRGVTTKIHHSTSIPSSGIPIPGSGETGTQTTSVVSAGFICGYLCGESFATEDEQISHEVLEHMQPEMWSNDMIKRDWY